MKSKHHKLPEHALGGQRQITSFHFGQPGKGEKIYLQAGLHADEVPGMLVLHYLKDCSARRNGVGNCKVK